MRIFNSGKNSSEAAQRSAWFVLSFVVLFFAFALYSLLVFVFQRPYFASSCLCLSGLLGWYLSKSTSRWHSSQHSENRFWMLIFAWLASALLFMPDSPLHIEYWAASLDSFLSKNTLGISIVVVSALLAHYVDKYHHRFMLAQRPKLKLSPSLVRLQEMSAKDMKLDQKISAVQECLKEVEFTYLPSNIHNYLNAQSIFQCERKIIQMIASASKDELNYMILKLNVRALLYRIRNHNVTTEIIDEDGLRVWGGVSSNQNLNSLLDVLTRQRVSDLSIAAKALILDSIQVNRLTVEPSTAGVAQAGAVNILLKTTGDQLSELKTIIDGKGSIQSTHKLVYTDIQNAELREKVLSHIQRQANIHAAHQMMRGSIAKRLEQRSAWRKILSDVDDTLLSSGGRYPAGIDTKYAHHLLYPGVIRFYRELDLGTHPMVENGEWPEERLGNLVFLSARPHVYKDMAEKRVYQKFEKMIHANNLHSMPTLLPGDMESGQAFMLRGDLEPMAQKKIRNFAEYFSLYPEFKHVFVGDNGQADVKAGADMLTNYGDSVEKVFIHRVQPIRKTFGYTPTQECEWRSKGMVFFETYVGAALEAAANTPPLIRLSGLRRVIISARDDFLKMNFKSARSCEARKKELNHDIFRANQFLMSKGHAAEPLLQYSQRFAVGSQVFCPYGQGVVLGFRASDGMYHVSVPTGGTCQLTVFMALSSLFPTQRKLLRASHGRVTYYQPDVKRLMQPPLFAPGSKVVCPPFGEGLVRRLRRDGMLEVNLTGFPGLLFTRTDLVTPEAGTRSRSGTTTAGSTGSIEIRGLFSLVRKTLGSPSKPAAKPFALDSQVHTPYGDGRVLALPGPGSPEMVEVALSWGARATLPRDSVEASDMPALALEPARPSPFQLARSYVSSSSSRVLSSVFRRQEGQLSPGKTATDLALGEEVRTKYGLAKVARCPETGTMALECLDWPATLYIHRDQLASTLQSDLQEAAAGGPSKVARILGFFSGVFPGGSESKEADRAEPEESYVVEAGDTVVAGALGKGVVLECLSPDNSSPFVRFRVALEMGADGYFPHAALRVETKYDRKPFAPNRRQSSSFLSYLGLAGATEVARAARFRVGDMVQLRQCPDLRGSVQSVSLVDLFKREGEAKYSVALWGSDGVLFAVDSSLEQHQSVRVEVPVEESNGMRRSSSRLSLSSLLSLASGTSGMLPEKEGADGSMTGDDEDSIAKGTLLESEKNSST